MFRDSHALVSSDKSSAASTLGQDKSASDLVALMIDIVQRCSVDAVQRLDVNDRVQHLSSPRDASLRILGVLQVHLFGITQAFVCQDSTSLSDNQNDEGGVQHDRANGADGCPSVVDALLRYLDALFIEAMTVLKKLHKASCQHEDVVAWRLNGSLFDRVLPNAVEALCVLLSRPTASLSTATSDLSVTCSQDLGLRFAHRLLPHIHSMLKTLDEVNWKVQSFALTSNQTRHDVDDSAATLELASPERHAWVSELQDACGILCGKLASAVAFASVVSYAFHSQEESAFETLSAKALAPGLLAPSLLDNSDASDEVTEILQWEKTGVFEIENELEPSDELRETNSERLLDTQAWLSRFVESPASDDALFQWIAARINECEASVTSAAAASEDVCKADSRLNLSIRALLAVVMWNCGVLDDCRHACEASDSDALGDSQAPSDDGRLALGRLETVLARVTQVVRSLARQQLNEPSEADTVVQTARFLLTLRPDPESYAPAISTDNERASVDFLRHVHRLIHEQADLSQWTRIAAAHSTDAALFRVGLCFFHDLLRKLTVSSTKSFLLGELIHAMEHRTSVRGRGPSHANRQRCSVSPATLKAVENLYIRIAKLLSTDESCVSLKQKALLAWTIPLRAFSASESAAADVIAKSGVASVLTDLLVDDVGVLEAHADVNGPGGAAALSTDLDSSVASMSPIMGSSAAHSRVFQRLKPVAALLFSSTPSQWLSSMAWTALCTIALQLNQSSASRSRPACPLLAPAAPVAISRSSSAKDVGTPRPATSPRKRLTLPKRTVISTVDESIERVYDVLFTMLAKAKNELETHAQLSAKLGLLFEQAAPAVSQQANRLRECPSAASQALLFGSPTPVSSISRHSIKHSVMGATSRDTVSAGSLGVTVCAWILIEHTGVADAGLEHDQPRVTAELPVLFALKSETADARIRTSESDSDGSALLVDHDVVVFAHTVGPKHVSLALAVRHELDGEATAADAGRWEAVTLSDPVLVGQWTQFTAAYDSETREWSVYLDDKRAIVSTHNRSVLEASVCIQRQASKQQLSVGGTLSEQECAALLPALETPSDVSPPSSKKSHFSAVLDDVWVLDTPMTSADIAWVAQRGPVLFQLKRLHTAESHCSDILQLLCQLGCCQDRASRCEAPASRSTRWLALFIQLVDILPLESLAQVCLRDLLRHALPRVPPAALSGISLSKLCESVFRDATVPQLSRTSLRNVVLQMNGLRASSSSWTADASLINHNETLQALLHTHQLGFGTSAVLSPLLTKFGSAAQTADDSSRCSLRSHLATLRHASSVRLFQRIWQSAGWCEEVRELLRAATDRFRPTDTTEALEGSSSILLKAPPLSPLIAASSALGGCAELAVNQSAAWSSQFAQVYLSTFVNVAHPLASTLATTKQSASSCDAVVLSPSAFDLICEALTCSLALSERRQQTRTTRRASNDTSALVAADQSVAVKVRQRASILRFLLAAARNDSIEQMWHSVDTVDSQEDATRLMEIAERVFALASNASTAFIVSTLGPESKRALRLRSVRTMLQQLLHSGSAETNSALQLSLTELETLSWDVWTRHTITSTTQDGPRWWQQTPHRRLSPLKVLGGEVELHHTTAKALEHFPTIRLANVAIAANTGLWFYEVVVLSDGLMQIGYIDADFVADPIQGQGVGDHASSWGFDGFRCKKWNVSSSDYGDAWRADDVVGVLLDTDRMELSFFLNGKFLGVAFSGLPMTASSRMCPAASLNVGQAAQFNFGASGHDSQQTQASDDVQLLGFAHVPALDSEQDQCRLQPLALAMPQQHGESQRPYAATDAGSECGELPNLELHSDASDDGEYAITGASTDDENENDETETFGARRPRTHRIDAGARESRSRETGDQFATRSSELLDESLVSRRNDLIDGLTGLGFPREWAIRCAIETNLSVNESGAVGWILEQMEKDATSATSEHARRGLESTVDAQALVDNALRLPYFANVRSADDLSLLPASGANSGFGLSLQHPYASFGAGSQGARPHTEHLSRHRLQLFADLDASYKRGASSASAFVDTKRKSTSSRLASLYVQAEQDDTTTDDELSIELFATTGDSSSALEQLRQAMHLSPLVHDTVEHKRTGDNSDDGAPLCLALDSLLTLLYARHTMLDLLASPRHREPMFRLVSTWCASSETFERLTLFLRATLGLGTQEPLVDTQHLSDGAAVSVLEQSEKLHATFRDFLAIECVRVRANQATPIPDSSGEGDIASGGADLPIFRALFRELNDQCKRALTSQRTERRQRPRRSCQRAAWALWLAGVVFSHVEQQREQTPQAEAIAAAAATTCYSLQFFESLVTIASSATVERLPWKLLAFALMKRVVACLSAPSASLLERPLCSEMANKAASAANTNASWSSDSLTLFLSAAHLPSALELLALRVRNESASRVFYSSLTQTLFSLLVQQHSRAASHDQLQTAKQPELESAACANASDFCIDALSTTQATVSWTSSASLETSGASNDSGEQSAETTVWSLSLTREPSPFADLSDSSASSDRPPRVLPSKGSYMLRNLAPDTRYIVRLSPVETMISLDASSSSATLPQDFGNDQADASALEPSVETRDWQPALPVRASADARTRTLRFQTPPEPLFQLDASAMGKNLALVNRNLSVKNLVNKKWHTVRASVGFDDGVHQWHVRIDTCVSKNIFVGVCSHHASLENYIGSDGYGYGFLANKAVWHNKSKLHSYGEIFKQGDVLQVTLDCAAKTLAFSRNGEYLGIAATNLHVATSGSVSSASLGPAASEACKWYPAISLYNKDDQVTVIPPSPATMFAQTQLERPQHASMLEMIEAMHVVSDFQACTTPALGSVRTGRVRDPAREALYAAAYADFALWRRGDVLFRERELGNFVRIDASARATKRFGLARGDSVFTARGQATVLGVHNHELWYECESESVTGEPALGVWSLHACKHMLASPNEFPVHRSGQSHHQLHQSLELDVHAFAISSGSDLVDHVRSETADSECALTLEAFSHVQVQWSRLDACDALDAKLLRTLDAIAAARSLSDPQCLSFRDVLAGLSMDESMLSLLAAANRSHSTSSTESKATRTHVLARMGLLLFVNRSVYRVTRLVVPERIRLSLLPCALPLRPATQAPKPSKRDDDEDDNDATASAAADKNKASAFANAVVATESIAALLQTPEWVDSDPSRLDGVKTLAARVLFRSQKDRLIGEMLRKTTTPTLHSAVNDLQTPSTEFTSSKTALDDAYDPSDLPRVRVTYSKAASQPFWRMSTESLQAHEDRSVFAISAHSRRCSAFAQVSEQLQRLVPRDWRRAFATPFEPLSVTRAFHVVATSLGAEQVTGGCEPRTRVPKTSMFESLDLSDHGKSLSDGDHEAKSSSAHDQQSPSQAAQYALLLETLAVEVQSPVFPLLVPIASDALSTKGDDSEDGVASRPHLELDVNTSLLAPSVVAHYNVSSDKVRQWYVQLGQLLGLAWRSNVLLPLQFVSRRFWRDVVCSATPSHRNDQKATDMNSAVKARRVLLDAVRDGLFAVVPSQCVAILTPNDLMRCVCDPNDVDALERLRAHAEFDANARHHMMFWDVAESFSLVERRALLQFVTSGSSSGSSSLCRNNTPFVLELSGDALADSQSHPDACYPVVVALSNQRSRLHLPAYSTLAAMRKKLTLAMTAHCGAV